MSSLDERDYEKFNMSFNDLIDEERKSPSRKKRSWFTERSCTNYCILVMFLVAVVCSIAVALIVYFETRERHNGNAILSTVQIPSTSQISTASPPAGKPKRLPRNFYPTNYLLNLKMYFPAPTASYPPEKNLTFDGVVAINITCRIASNNVSLHANMDTLVFNNQSISMLWTNPNGKVSSLSWNGYEYDKLSQIITFNLDSTVPANSKIILTIGYTGTMMGKGQLAGLFYLKYRDFGQAKWMVVTQMESTDARRVVPCFDEPGFKARFTLTLTYPIGLTALSNEQGYLANQTREASVLYQEGKYIPQAQQRVAHEIAHEFAHQWFGNLVTMDWWDDLWLNEGFAKYMEFIGADVITNGSLHMSDQFVLICTQSAMQKDQLTTSHPIYVHVQSSDAIGGIFDSISYKKGAAVLKMLRNTIGEELFRVSIIKYLRKYKYRVANHGELWETFTEVVQRNGSVKDWNGKPLNVSLYMDTWINQMGFPVLNVNVTKTGQYQITQKRFLLNSNATMNSNYANNPYKYQWYVPVWIETRNATNLIWLQPNRTVTISSGSILLNPNVYGFYRVNYDSATWMTIQNKLLSNPSAFDVSNRAQIIDDTMTLARAGQLPYSTALSTLNYLSKEKSSIPWTSATDDLGFIRDMFMTSATNQYLNGLLMKLIGPIYASNSYWNSSNYNHLDVLAFDFQKLVLNEACSLGIGDCSSQAHKFFKSFISACINSTQGSTPCSKVPNNLRSIVYCSGIASGSVAEWNILWKLFSNELIAFESLSLLQGLSCTTRPWQLQKILDAALAHTVIPQENFQYAVSDVGVNPIGNELMWNYIEINWKKILETFGHELFGYGSLVKAATYTFNTQYQIDLLETFIKTHKDLGTGKSAFFQALETAKSNFGWMKNYSHDVIQWLQNNSEIRI